MVSEVIYPFKELRKNMEALEGVRSLCLAEPEPKAVHRLRTLSRRIEAQLWLLHSLSPDAGQIEAAPGHKKGFKRLKKELKQLRQGAGSVRDLDVQRERVGKFAKAEGGGDLEETDAKSDDKDPFQEGAALLCAYLERKRTRAAADLQAHLRKHEGRIADAARTLLLSLDETHEPALSVEELLARAGSVGSSHDLLQKNLRRTLTEEQLHTARKAVKSARYLAEMMPRNEAAQRAAKRFEALQDAGGIWHDDLELARTAKRVLGKKHLLTVRMLQDQRHNLRLYREALRGEALRGEARRPDQTSIPALI